MKNAEINIRDPFVLCENGIYYMYGTRAENFGQGTGGFDVYIGTDLKNWSAPKQVFSSADHGLNHGANWAPEVHAFNGKYYMLATFEQKNGNRGTYALVSDTPDGCFCPVSGAALTPEDWWSLDGTLYADPAGEPYLIFCHEHVQILNGTVCCVKLKKDLSAPVGEPVCLFYGSEAYGAKPYDGNRFVTDGPFLYRGRNGRLYMIWSTSVAGEYAQCIAVSESGTASGPWKQLPPVFTKDGGHGMVFRSLTGKLMLTLHCPNTSLSEHPAFFELEDTGETLRIKE